MRPARSSCEVMHGPHESHEHAMCMKAQEKTFPEENPVGATPCTIQKPVMLDTRTWHGRVRARITTLGQVPSRGRRGRGDSRSPFSRVSGRVPSCDGMAELEAGMMREHVEYGHLEAR